jgi:lipoate-protein ligase A
MWSLIGADSRPAHVHMALDEVLLERVISGRRGPTLRFWRWIEPALVLGSHQSVANEVDLDEATRRGFTIARRISGGGTMLCEPGRTLTWSIYADADIVKGMSFVDSFRVLDAFAVDALRALGVDASYRPINDIVSPKGKIAGAAQARRRHAVLHHTTLAYAMDPELVPTLIRLGRDRVNEKGIRSAEKAVSPLSWFTKASLDELEEQLASTFRTGHQTQPDEVREDELEEAQKRVEERFSTREWLYRLP